MWLAGAHTWMLVTRNRSWWAPAGQAVCQEGGGAGASTFTWLMAGQMGPPSSGCPRVNGALLVHLPVGTEHALWNPKQPCKKFAAL